MVWKAEKMGMDELWNDEYNKICHSFRDKELTKEEALEKLYSIGLDRDDANNTLDTVAIMEVD